MGIPRADYKLTRVIDYVKSSAERLSSRDVVFTGHSLGGGIALAAAALVNKPVVAFSPPGMYQSISKHLYRYAPDRRQAFQATHNQSVTIIGENDVVSHIFDTHAGLVQTITCSTEHLAMVGCHMLENTLCNLIRHCKGCHTRHGFDSCHFKYDSKIIMANVARMLDVPYVSSTALDVRTILESSRYYILALVLVLFVILLFALFEWLP